MKTNLNDRTQKLIKDLTSTRKELIRLSKEKGAGLPEETATDEESILAEALTTLLCAEQEALKEVQRSEKLTIHFPGEALIPLRAAQILTYEGKVMFCGTDQGVIYYALANALPRLLEEKVGVEAFRKACEQAAREL